LDERASLPAARRARDSIVARRFSIARYPLPVRSLYAVFLGTFTLRFSTGLTGGLFLFYIAHLHRDYGGPRTDETTLAVMVALFYASELVLATPFGMLSDRIGHRRVMQIVRRWRSRLHAGRGLVLNVDQFVDHDLGLVALNVAVHPESGSHFCSTGRLQVNRHRLELTGVQIAKRPELLDHAPEAGNRMHGRKINQGGCVPDSSRSSACPCQPDRGVRR